MKIIEEKYKELYEKAISRMLNKTDFDATEWLNKDEKNDFLNYQDAIFNSNNDANEGV